MTVVYYRDAAWWPIYALNGCHATKHIRT